MEQRKIQIVGGGTYSVSLPKEWAEQNGLSAGSPVYIEVHGDDQVVIEPAPSDDDVTSSLCLGIDDHESTRLERSIKAAYASGFDELVLRASDGFTETQRRTVRRVTNEFVGVTLTTESETELVVQTLLDASEVSIRQSVRQLRFTALSMHREAVTALLDDGTPASADRDDDADRLYAMIDRHLKRGLTRLDEVDALGVSRAELFELRTTARELERVADHAERIGAVAETVETLPEAVSADQLQRIAEDARTVVERATAVAVGDASREQAHAVLQTRDETRAALDSVDSRLAQADGSYRLGRAVDALRRTAECGGNIAELGLRVATRHDRAVQDSDVPATVDD